MQPPRPPLPLFLRADLWVLLGFSLALHAGLLVFGPGWYLALSADLRNWGPAAGAAAPLSPTVPTALVPSLPVPPIAAADLVSRSGDRSALGSAERGNPKAPANAEHPPVIKKSASPVYPEIARRAQIQSRVVARVLVDEQGQVARLDHIDGPAVFREAVAAAVRQWEFEPARQGELAVRAWVSLPFVFRLE